MRVSEPTSCTVANSTMQCVRRHIYLYTDACAYIHIYMYIYTYTCTFTH
jgi:hypothetical protein